MSDKQTEKTPIVPEDATPKSPKMTWVCLSEGEVAVIYKAFNSAILRENDAMAASDALLPLFAKIKNGTPLPPSE